MERAKINYESNGNKLRCFYRLQTLRYGSSPRNKTRIQHVHLQP